MLFNFGKFKCLHTGPGNIGMTYEMGGTILSKTVKEKDLGVTMNANMKVSEQCRIAAMLGSFHFHRGPSMYGINYQQSVCMLVVLICSRIDKYLFKAGYTYNNGRLHLE